VADQLGHADPAFTWRIDAHRMSDEEPDLSFVEFGGSKQASRGETQLFSLCFSEDTRPTDAGPKVSIIDL